MNAKVWVIGATALFVAACGDIESASNEASFGLLVQVPEGVRNLAASGQDLSAVRIDPVDGCYVYRHVGPVETTYLPLRSAKGNPICSRAAGTPAPVTG